MSSAPTRHELLATLVAERVGMFDALCAVNGFHNGRSGPTLPRMNGARVAEKVFAHPGDVPMALLLVFHRIEELFSQCQRPLDDLHVAVFGTYCVLEIHPFENGNGRTAIDFAQYLLMHRWGHAQPVLPMDDSIHPLVGHVLQNLGIPCDGRSAGALEKARDHFLGLVHNLTVPKLYDLGPVHELATGFSSSVTIDAQIPNEH